MAIVLEARSLTKRYDDFTLKDISFEIPSGCVFGVFGPTGAGKTTLMKLLIRQIPASSGTVRIFGLGYDDREKEIKNRIGYVPQEPFFYQDRSVEFNARFAASFYQRWDRGSFDRLLEEFKVGREKTFKRLSRGQKTLFAIALALSHQADLLVLDEPTAGLDVILRRTILERLRRFAAEEERTVVVASHVTDGLGDIAESVNVLDRGKFVLQSDRDELLARWKRIHFKEGALPPALIEQLTDVRRQPFGSSGLTPDFPGIRASLEEGIVRGDVRIENAGLDDILIAMHQGE